MRPRIDDDLHARLKTEAAAEDCSVTELVNRWLGNRLDEKLAKTADPATISIDSQTGFPRANIDGRIYLYSRSKEIGNDPGFTTPMLYRDSETGEDLPRSLEKRVDAGIFLYRAEKARKERAGATAPDQPTTWEDKGDTGGAVFDTASNLR